MRVLVVEDSAQLLDSLTAALTESGYAVDSAAEGEQALWLATTNAYDVVVLDVMLPKLDGWTVLRRLREAGNQSPVLFLTAKDTVADRVRGLEAGADDYLVKPFAIEEVLARVGALCRRAYGQRRVEISVGDLEIDTAAKRVRRGGHLVELTSREYALLEYLARRAGTVVSRAEIEAHIYDEHTSPMSNVVDATVYALRKKLAVPEGAPALIHTRRGQGYQLEPAGE
jgi:DNA-binding response OmpR family regulator